MKYFRFFDGLNTLMLRAKGYYVQVYNEREAVWQNFYLSSHHLNHIMKRSREDYWIKPIPDEEVFLEAL